MIKAGHQLRSIKFLVRHIIDKGYDSSYLLGISLFNLLTSIPIDNKVDYNKILKVEVDQLKNMVKFDYRNWAGLNRESKEGFDESLKWSDTCQLTESCDTFEHFRRTFPEFRSTKY